MRPPRILVCNAQVPFARGGAETLVEALAGELARRGFTVDTVALPFAWNPRSQIFQSALAWRLVDVSQVGGEPVDLVIATRFPSYLVRHPNKVVWLIHQFRQVYELLGTPYSDFGPDSEDREAVEMVRSMDRRGLGEARRIFTISRNTADRLRRFLGIDGEALYHPSPLSERLRRQGGERGPGDYVLAVGRLDALKRFDLLVEALAATREPVRVVFAGDGAERAALAELAAARQVADRVEWAGRVDDDLLAELYGGALGIFYAPFDEDYGYVTLEAFSASRPVITTPDAGGVLEFVDDGETGLVAEKPTAGALARQLDRLYRDRELARRLGAAGRGRVEGIDWQEVIDRLTATL